DSQVRIRTKIAGEIKRMRIKPRSGVPAVELVINDGTGEATVIFSGRRNIPGVDHGKCIMVDGVPHRDGGRTVILNPAYTLLG
ncbi:MAG: OB-fold nucleic acid binding domain-containing protein, partial [Acidimicrobiaceae bacterium]